MNKYEEHEKAAEFFRKLAKELNVAIMVTQQPSRPDVPAVRHIGFIPELDIVVVDHLSLLKKPDEEEKD